MPTALGSSIKIGGTTLHANIVRTDRSARLAENSHSGVTSTNYDNVIPDNSWQGEIPWDETNLPDTDFGLVPGTKVTLVFPFGGTGKTETLTDTTVERVSHIKNNGGDILRSVVSGKGGDYTAPVT